MNVIKDNMLLLAAGGLFVMGGLTVWGYNQLTRRTEEAARGVLDPENGGALGMHNPALPISEADSLVAIDFPLGIDHSTIDTTPENPNNTQSVYTVYRAFQVTQALTRVLLEMVPDGDRSNPLTKGCLDEMEQIIRDNRETTKTLIETGGLLLKYLTDLKESNKDAFNALMIGFEEAIYQAKNYPEFINEGINVTGEFAKFFNELHQAKPAESKRVLLYLVEVTHLFSQQPELVEGISKGAFTAAETLFKIEKEKPQQYQMMCEGAERLIKMMTSKTSLVRDVTKTATTVVAATASYASSSEESSKDVERAEQFLEDAIGYAAENPELVEEMTKGMIQAASILQEFKQDDPETAKQVEEGVKEMLEKFNDDPEMFEWVIKKALGFMKTMVKLRALDDRLGFIDPNNPSEAMAPFDHDSTLDAKDLGKRSKSASCSAKGESSDSLNQAVRSILTPRDQVMLAVMAQMGVSPQAYLERITGAGKTNTTEETSVDSSSASSSSSSSSSSWPSSSDETSSSSSTGSSSSSEYEAVKKAIESLPSEVRESVGSCFSSMPAVKLMRSAGIDPVSVLKNQ